MAVTVKPFEEVFPQIYAYTTPNDAGWMKIGYTEKQTVEQRITQQFTGKRIKDWELKWHEKAVYRDGSEKYFTDHNYHHYLEWEHNIPRVRGTEWFNIDGDTSHDLFEIFVLNKSNRSEHYTYTLRAEQERAVQVTKDYFKQGGKEFLWNAKPRFGKTLTSYDLVQRMGFSQVLIVSNRPSISNSWWEDFDKFVGWHDEYCFVSDTDALKGKPGVLSQEYLSKMRALGDVEWKDMIAFESLQGLKGSVYFGGEYDKLKWIFDNEFDLLIVDEAQEGVDTMRTDRAFDNIRRKHTLYLSGTPFKQLASDRFSAEQIYNWSYADEQAAKENWEGPDTNPYATLPRMAMFTYQLSNMIYDEVQKGLDLSGEDGTVDYAFDLNEFFITNESGKLVHEDDIKRFLHALATQEKYPFSTPELRGELSHTLWLLNRVASAKALAKLLNDDPVFSEYKIVLAAGDGKLDPDEESAAAFDKVKKAIRENEKTITLSVGQLTVGVTIPEWSAVLMLCNMTSPSSYMQAAFRAQNPCMMHKNGQNLRKETAYVFDFDPARTLIIFDEFANNLRPDTAAGRGTGDDRKDNIKELLNFFPVLGEDKEGKMVALDAAEVLSIPGKLKSQEVVRHGFMSNFLFQNIGNVFGAPSVVKDIIEKLQPAHEEKPNARREDPLAHIQDVPVDENGDVDITDDIVIGRTQDLFGPKIYAEMKGAVQDHVDAVSNSQTPEEMEERFDDLLKRMQDTVKDAVVTPTVEKFDLKKGTQNRIEKQVERDIQRDFDRIHGDYVRETNIAKAELERKRKEAETEQETKQAEDDFQKSMQDAMKAFQDTVMDTVQKTIESKPQELVNQLEKDKAEQEKRGIEDSIRSHLRGFARTIPSFIMAYGDGKLTLANFDEYTEEEVFLEVTGITLENFRFLRDGGAYNDPDTGEEQYFAGHLFDEVVFDDSVKEFWDKKQKLADYFGEAQDEDIFDYIPPQKTNQIFTPKWVVKKMVDELEENNPGCFDDPNHTFADLYMKSGLYITEIAKRLFRSEAMKRFYPDDAERKRHILQRQVYGMAPTRIIYLIATNFILGFDETMKVESHNFVQADAAEAAKNGTLSQLVNQYFG